MSSNVTIVTPWRQRASEITAYQDRLAALDYDPAHLRYAMLENDSTDGTDIELREWAALDPRIQFAKRDTGAPLFGSVIDPVRFHTMGTVFNWALSMVDLDWSDYVFFLPCDIRYPPRILKRLLAHRKPIIAPFVFLSEPDERFYDVWAFSRNGKNFGHFRRRDVEQIFGVHPIELDTIGGVTLIDCAVLRAGCRYSTENVDRGLCEAARAAGFTVWADPSLHVFHGA